MFRKVILPILLLLLLVGGWWTYRLVIGRPTNINMFYERAMIATALDNPQALTSIGLVDNTWLDFHSGKLSDASPAATDRQLARARAQLAMLRAYPRDKQTDDQRLSTDILGWWLDDQVRGADFRFHDYPVNQLFGEQTELIDFMVQQHQVPSVFAAHRYIARLRAVPTHIDQLLESLKLREDRHILLPRFAVDEVITQLRGIIEPPPEKNILATSFEKKLAKISNLSADDHRQLTADLDSAIADAVYPAYRKLLAYEVAYEPRARTTDGVWDLPNGDAFYAYELRSQTTSDMTPDEVHAYGLSEVARIEAEIAPILAPLNLPGDTIGARITALSHDTRYNFSNDDAGRAKILDGYRALLADMWTHLPEQFSLLPNQKPEVRAIPAFKAENSPGAYYEGPALDGTRPGVFYVNLSHPSETQSWGMKTLAYHEGIPGHHLQLTIATELTGEPTFRKVLGFTAYQEGWALYAERLGWEMGFEKDPLDNLGRLQAELFRAVRLVVDTGIHAKHWTRDQAITYMTDNTGMGTNEVRAEIERYVVMPGQACAYKVGMARILKLRDDARAAQGAKFDIRAFHKMVTGAGAMPLDVLEARAAAWEKG